MKELLEGEVLGWPRSYTTPGKIPVTVFKLQVDKEKLGSWVIMPDVVDVTIQEKRTFRKGERIRGFYETNSTSIYFDRYQLLDENGEPVYENTINRD